MPAEPPKRNRVLASVLVFVAVGAGLAASELTRSDKLPDHVDSRLDKRGASVDALADFNAEPAVAEPDAGN